MEAENNAALANLETHFDYVLLNQTSKAPIKMIKDCSNKKEHNLNKTYQMNNLTDYINQIKNYYGNW